jgi:hypothetical protein
MENNERRYFFWEQHGRTLKKKKKISVKESDLSDNQKDIIYSQFLEYFAGLPKDVNTRFMKSVILNLNQQAELQEQLKKQTATNG